MPLGPEDRMARARTHLLLDFPWFGSLAMHLRVEPTDKIPTVGTDGTRLVYNPEFIQALPDNYLKTVYAHEVAHCAFMHPYRRGLRNFPKWNRACVSADTAILMADGSLRPIAMLRPGDLVASPLGPNRVLDVLSKGYRKTVELAGDTGGKIYCTPDHQFLTTEGLRYAQDIADTTRAWRISETPGGARVRSGKLHGNEREGPVFIDRRLLHLNLSMPLETGLAGQGWSVGPTTRQSSTTLKAYRVPMGLPSRDSGRRGDDHNYAEEAYSRQGLFSMYGGGYQHLLATVSVSGGIGVLDARAEEQFRPPILATEHLGVSDRHSVEWDAAIPDDQEGERSASAALYRHQETASAFARRAHIRDVGDLAEDQGAERTRVQIRAGVAEVRRVFDIITEHHCYYANGFLVHNCDHVINVLLKEAGFDLPPDALCDPQYAGMSAEAVYAMLPDEPEDEGRSQCQGISTGTVDDPSQGPPEEGEGPGKNDGQGRSQMREQDWQIAVEAATAACKEAGIDPSNAAIQAKAAAQRPQDWRTILREFIQNLMPKDYTWASPNRRFIANGLYLPGILKENLARIGLGIDSSGSTMGPAFDAFHAEVQEILLEVQPSSVVVTYGDCTVQNTQEFTPDDFSISDLRPKGGGGTAFQPILDHFSKMDEPPVCVIYFTDLENGGERLTPPEYPVLWVTGINVTKDQPFGQLVRIDANI